jgi:hypothetical protein
MDKLQNLNVLLNYIQIRFHSLIALIFAKQSVALNLTISLLTIIGRFMHG